MASDDAIGPSRGLTNNYHFPDQVDTLAAGKNRGLTMTPNEFPLEKTRAGLQYVIPGAERRLPSRRRSYPIDAMPCGDQYVIPGAQRISDGEYAFDFFFQAFDVLDKCPWPPLVAGFGKLHPFGWSAGNLQTLLALWRGQPIVCSLYSICVAGSNAINPVRQSVQLRVNFRETLAARIKKWTDEATHILRVARFTDRGWNYGFVQQAYAGESFSEIVWPLVAILLPSGGDQAKKLPCDLFL